jgi:leucyl aminopeptidase
LATFLTSLLDADAAAPARPVVLVPAADTAAWLERAEPAARAWLGGQDFRGERGRLVILPDASGAPAGAVLGLGEASSTVDPWFIAGLVDRLPPGAPWRLEGALDAADATHACLGWLLGGYRYARYREPAPVRDLSLVAPRAADLPYARAAAEAVGLARDLINTPANDLGPDALEDAVREIGSGIGARVESIVGDALIDAGFPLIHAVGRASRRAPRLLDIRAGDADAPKVTLVGKGVCFDSGGLDLKNSTSMLLMKKDMGGAACALALTQLLVRLNVPLRLRLLIPAVENAVSGDAYRPGDVLPSRKGLTVEIGNTDAEGRLVLADALAEADTERPDLLIDLATLTGAARTALGPDLPAAYCTDAGLLEELRACGERECDPLWPMPLWRGYDEDLASRVADVNNVAAHAFAGSVIGALFLKRFVTATPRWLHLDLYAWNPKDRPGRPLGGEGQAVRALAQFLRSRFG